MTGRPERLYPLFADLETLPAIGPKSAKALETLRIISPRDLLYTLPIGLVDRRRRDTVQGVPLPEILTVEVTIGTHRKASRPGGTYRIFVEDASASFQLVWFRGREAYLKDLAPEGSRRLVSGKVELFDNMAQMAHPDHVLPIEDAGQIPEFEPVYPLTAGVTQKAMFKASDGALDRIEALPEWADSQLVDREGWPAWHAAMRVAHRPEAIEQTAATSPARMRLAYDEVFAHQVTLGSPGNRSNALLVRKPRVQVFYKAEFCRRCRIRRRVRNRGLSLKLSETWRVLPA